MKVIAFDTETFPFVTLPSLAKKAKAAANVCPRFVCLSYTVLDETGLQAPRLVTADEGVALWCEWIEDPEVHLVGLNTAFDVSVMVRAAYERAEVNTLPAVFDAYASEPWRVRMSDVSLREKLHDISLEGLPKGRSYSMLNIAKRRLGIDLGDVKADGWRTRYNHLADLPLDEWPEEAVNYALDDARITMEIHLDQLRSFSAVTLAGRDMFPQSRASSADLWGVFADEALQMRYALGCQLMSVWGLGVDQRKVAGVRYAVDSQLAALGARLESYGLLVAGKLAKAPQQDLMSEAVETLGLAGDGETLAKLRTKTGAWSLATSSVNVLEDLGYEDPKFVALQQFVRARKFLSSYVEPLELVGEWSLCPWWGTIVASGRGSCSRPNVQQFPKHKKPGMVLDPLAFRGCFRPRPGWVYVGADWSTAELRTLAQACVSLGLGRAMADALNGGRDLHTAFACRLAGGVDYDVAVKALADPEHPLHAKMKSCRRLAKVANFGFPGGLGPKGLIAFARAGYGVKISYDEARDLKTAWLDQWPEVRRYFDYIRTLDFGGEWPSPHEVPQHGPNGTTSGWRIRMCEDRNSACNTLFQGMAADAMKAAFWEIVRECYVDESSALYGFRPNAVIHDEFLLEGPPDRAEAAGARLITLMNEALELFTPDVVSKADLTISDVWGA